MNLLEKILEFISKEMTVPSSYGVFHIISIILIIGFTMFLCVKFKNCDNKTYNKILMISWVVIVVLEIYKQIIFSFQYVDQIIKWDYLWYFFPFQFCSTPLYVLPFIVFLKEGKIRNAFIAYTATFAFFGGFVVLCYPNDVFHSVIGINFQTMIHHGLQFILGIFTYVKYRNEFNFKFFLKGIIVFCSFLIIALLINVCSYHIFKSFEMNDYTNMFFIGPYYDCTLPILSLLYPKIPYVCFILIYSLGFSIASYLIYLIFKFISEIIKKAKKDVECM